MTYIVKYLGIQFNGLERQKTINCRASFLSLDLPLNLNHYNLICCFGVPKILILEQNFKEHLNNIFSYDGYLFYQDMVYIYDLLLKFMITYIQLCKTRIDILFCF